MWPCRAVNGQPLDAYLYSLSVLLLVVRSARCQLGTTLDAPGSFFQGQGTPPRNGTIVYFSAFLERMLVVNQAEYSFTGAFTFQLNWNDDGAADEIESRTKDLEDSGDGACNRYCNNYGAPWDPMQQCCDSIFLPSLLVTNVRAYEESGHLYYKISTCGAADMGNMMWSAKVTATFYTGMKFTSFPFDYQNLVVQFEQPDEYRYNFGYIKYNLSASGVSTRFDQGFVSGDAVSGWAVQGIQMQLVKTANTDIYKDVDPSNPGDTCAFNPAAGIDLQHELDVVESIQISVRVRRLNSYPIVNIIIPILVIAYMNFAIYFIPPKDFNDRFGTLSTLLLALMAVQFVVGTDLPASSTPLPQQQLIIATWCFEC